MKTIFLAIVIAFTMFSFTSQVSSAELITNGGFETGTFAGWTAVNGVSPWQVWQNSPAGVNTGYGLAVTAPQEGTRLAWQGVAGAAGATFTLSQDITIPSLNSATFTWKDRFQQDLFTFCTGAGCGTNPYRVQILNTSNTVLQTLYTSTALPGTIHDTGWQTHSASLNAYSGQTIRIRFSTVVTVFYDGPGQLEIDAVSVNAFVPTAANVSVSGRVVSANGSGIRNATLSLIDSNGNIRTARTGSFGYYSIDDVPTGTYVLSISTKRFVFVNPTRVISLADNLGGVDFVAENEL